MTFIDLVPNPHIRRRDKVRDWFIATGWEVLAEHWMKRIALIVRKGNTVLFVSVHSGAKQAPREKDRGWIATAGAMFAAQLGDDTCTFHFDTACFPPELADVEPGFLYTHNAWSVVK